LERTIQESVNCIYLKGFEVESSNNRY
jgi:hypothetical protein